MAEEFNPNAFRQQMAQQAGQIPAPVSAPQPPSVPQIPGQRQAPAPQQYAPQQYTPQHAPQPQQAPQQPVQYQGQPQQAAHPQGAQQQGRHPQPGQFQQPQLQQGYAQPPQTHGHHQAGHQGTPVMTQGSSEIPKAKRSLFKRKKLKSLAMPAAPQVPQMQGQMDTALNSIPKVGGVARSIVFVAGLALGVLGTMASIMLFSGGEPQKATLASNGGQLSSLVTTADGSTQMALTDEMLLNSETNKNGEP